MPFDGVGIGKLVQLRKVIAKVPDEMYDQNKIMVGPRDPGCALVHADRAGLYEFGRMPGSADTGRLFDHSWNGGPKDKAGFLARLDTIIAKKRAKRPA
jgi:hypothetical protein